MLGVTHYQSNSSINQCCLKDTHGKTQAQHSTRIGWGKEFNRSATNDCKNLLTDEFHYDRDMARKIIPNLGSNLWFYRSFGGRRREKENSEWMVMIEKRGKSSCRLHLLENYDRNYIQHWNNNNNTERGSHSFVMLCYVILKYSTGYWAGTPPTMQSHW